MSWRYERHCFVEGHRIIVGIDEAGRGPLAGPVVAAAVALKLDARLPRNMFGLDDSKKLSESTREQLFDELTSNALAIGVGIRTHEEIDIHNILQATMLAMTDAVEQIRSKIHPEMLLVDGNYFRTTLNISHHTIIKGDAMCPSIAAASIIAKVTRDRIMQGLHGQYPEYNFARNKGYGTLEHRRAIAAFGYSPVHRKSFVLKSPL